MLGTARCQSPSIKVLRWALFIVWHKQNLTISFSMDHEKFLVIKKGREVPGPSKKVLGLLDLFSPGTFWSRDLQGL